MRTNRIRGTTALAATALVAALSLTACGGGNEGTSGAGPAPAAASNTDGKAESTAPQTPETTAPPTGTPADAVQEAPGDPDAAAAELADIITADPDSWLAGARRPRPGPPHRRHTGGDRLVRPDEPRERRGPALRGAPLLGGPLRPAGRGARLRHDDRLRGPPADHPGGGPRLAAEHYAFCPDNIDQSPPYDLDVYAEKHLPRPGSVVVLVGLTTDRPTVHRSSLSRDLSSITP
ncbi:hypothetical protein SMICM17S_03831 [Streptomyces microflavus]